MKATTGLTPRSIVCALALLVGINLLMRTCEFVMGRYITAGVPPVAAVGGLFLLLAVNAMLRGRFERHRFTHAELLTVYAGLCLGCATTGTYGVRSIFPYFSVLGYYDQPTNHFASLAEGLPGWYILKSHTAIRGLYEGSPGAGVPWTAWRGVLLAWGSFLLVLFGGVACLTAIVRRPWMDHDRLMFPVTQLPIVLTQPGLRLLANPFFWGGVLVAALVNATNIGHAFVESIPAIKPVINMPAGIQRPFGPLASMVLYNRPEIYGFAYWVPSEILFSGWFSYLAVRAFAVLGTMGGIDQPGFPFTQEQATGGYLALAVILCWGIRAHLRKVLAGLIARQAPDDADEPLPYRLAVFGWLGSVGYCAWFLARAGVPAWLAWAYLIVVSGFALVYARLRAEAGLALEFIYPYGYPRRFLVQSFGADSILIASHGPQGLTAFYVAGFLARFHTAFWTAGYQLDGMRLAETAGVRQRRMIGWLLAMLVLGTALATFNYLSYNYQHGLNFFEGRAGSADWRTGVVLKEYEELGALVLKPEPTDRVRLLYTAAGAAVTTVLAAVRRVSLGFSVHPVGYVLATAYGDTSPMWWPFFAVWLLKSALLRYGGLKLYRQFMPAFVGLIAGHYLIGGLAWSILSASATPDIAHRYYTIFG